MPHDRFFVTEKITPGSLQSLSQEESDHLIKVMRKNVGDTFELCNGKGQLATARIVKINKKETVVEPLDCLNMEKPSRLITLRIAFLQPKHLDLVIEKCTELGVDQFILFPTSKSVKDDLSKNQLERLEKILISSLKQSGRLYLPKISVIGPIKSWSPFNEPTFFGSLKDQPPHLLSLLDPQESTTCIIGPESGFSEMEENQLIHLKGCPVTLHKNILRAETAAIAAACYLYNKSY